MTHPTLERSCAICIYNRFCDFQNHFNQITKRAADRFMQQQWRQIRTDTGERQSLYKTGIDQTKSDVQRLLGNEVSDKKSWTAIKTEFADLIVERIDPELAETFFNSVTRRIFGTIGVNKDVEFVNNDRKQAPTFTNSPHIKRYPMARHRQAVIRQILCDFEDVQFNEKALETVLPRIVEKVENRLRLANLHTQSIYIEMFQKIFYRGQGAYLIGRIVSEDRILPLVFALLHLQNSVAVDAVVLDSDGVSIVFSYTRSAFQVQVEKPRELIDFLSSIMPSKPKAELYSAIGYFKHGKTVLYRDVCRHTAECFDGQFNISPGKRGMVMIVFDMAGHDMVIKLIRDRFDNPKKTTRNKVMGQYEFVFNHYRVGRLIEAHTFEQLSFDCCWFSDELLDILKTEAGETVHVEGDRIIIAHAYLERRVTPLDIYVKEENDEKVESAVVDFGNAIKDMAFANIFPGDMLLKNFGVTGHGRVVFYDYDEIVPLTDCHFRSIPQARTYMDEMASEPWYTVEENDVFPEEFSRFLGLSPKHRNLFLKHHADLLEPDFWVDIQKEIRSGYLRHIRPYHPKYRIVHPES